MSWTQPTDPQRFSGDFLTNPYILSDGAARPAGNILALSLQSLCLSVSTSGRASWSCATALHIMTLPDRSVASTAGRTPRRVGRPARRSALMVNESGDSLTKPCTAARRLSVVLWRVLLLCFPTQEIGVAANMRNGSRRTFRGNRPGRGYRLVDRPVTDLPVTGRMNNPKNGSVDRLGLVGVVLGIEWIADAGAHAIAVPHRGDDEGWCWHRPYSGEMTVGFI